MFWEAPQALGGPVLAWELTRGTRQTWPRQLRYCYTAWLVLQCLSLFTAYASVSNSGQGPGLPVVLLDPQEVFSQRAAFLDGYLLLLLQQHLLLLVLLIPALTAGSLGQEKERGTLFALFGTELTSRQIVLGKLLGRLAPAAPLLLTPLPVLVMVAAHNGREASLLFLALAQEAIVVFALAAACLLVAIWIRKASDAILASYALLGLAYLASRLLPASQPWLRWLDPSENLDRLLAAESDSSWPVVLLPLAGWAVMGAGCLVLACLRLRRACLEQGEHKPSRRLWAFRPPVGDNPIRWRERYVIGLAPLPFLRVVPRWLALLGVFAFSSALAFLAADSLSPGLSSALGKANFELMLANLPGEGDRLDEVIPILGLAFIFLAEVLVGVRCGTSVAEEKRRHTWDDLLLTAQSFDEITKSKMWGVLGAAFPYVIAYAVPMLALASRGGYGVLLTACLWIFLPCGAVFIGALLGMKMLRVPPDMDETRKGGAFYFERKQRYRRRNWTEEEP